MVLRPGVGYTTTVWRDGREIRRILTSVATLPSDGDWELVFESPAVPHLTGALSRQAIVSIEMNGFQLGDHLPPLAAADPRLLQQARLRMRPNDAELERELGVAQYYKRLRESLEQVSHMHPQDAELQRTLTREMPDPSVLARTNPDALLLLVTRGLAWWQTGDATAARRDLEAAGNSAALASTSSADDAQICFEIFATLAEIAVSEGRGEAGRAMASKAVTCGPDPDLDRERLRRRELLADVAQDPAWLQVLGRSP